MFPACVVTCAQSHKFKDVVDLSEMVMTPPGDTVGPVSDSFETSESPVDKQTFHSPVTESIEVTLSSPVTLSAESEGQLVVGKEQLIAAQKTDPSLAKCSAATRYPEAIPIRSLKAKVVVKELLKFCTTFGLPKVIQTDQGTNFMSKVFAQVLEVLSVKHQISSAYHPESQEAKT